MHFQKVIKKRDTISSNDQEANHGDAILEKSQSHVGRVRLPQEQVINLKASVEKPMESSIVKIKPKIDFSIEAILSSDYCFFLFAKVLTGNKFTQPLPESAYTILYHRSTGEKVLAISISWK